MRPLPDPEYNPPFPLSNGHFQTIFPSLCRRVAPIDMVRERITTFDGDFIDLDWSRNRNSRLAVISHGLEGNSHRAYVRGMARALHLNNWDVLAWNYRSCSGEPNRLLRSYHNGVTDDLAWVIRHGAEQDQYREIALVGFSLGGNLTLLYLGREETNPLVKKAVVFSVPCDLRSGAELLARPTNRIYMKYFLDSLHEKIRAKMELMPGEIDDKGYEQIKDFKSFDDRYTAPIHGFKDAYDYWRKCSSKQYIPAIATSTLIVNAINDPFLPDACYPVREAEQNSNVELVMPKSGGHVGFVALNRDGLYWSERMAVAFLEKR